MQLGSFVFSVRGKQVNEWQMPASLAVDLLGVLTQFSARGDVLCSFGLWSVGIAACTSATQARAQAYCAVAK